MASRARRMAHVGRADSGGDSPPVSIVQGSDVMPVPDPTRLTTDLLRREIAALKDILEARRDAEVGAITARLDASDKAIELLQSRADRLLSVAVVEQRVADLRELHEEKFKSIQVQFQGIQTQFIERDTRTEQMAKATETAVNAALQAAKEAVGANTQSSDRSIQKSETAFTKQIDQIGLLFQTMEKTIGDKFGDMKDRITSIEGRKQGGGEAWGYVMAGVGVLIAMISATVAIIALNHR